MLQNDRFPDQVRILLFLWNIDPINFPTRSLGIFLFLFLIFFFFLAFYFETITDLWEVAKMLQRGLCALHPVSPSGNI